MACHDHEGTESISVITFGRESETTTVSLNYWLAGLLADSVGGRTRWSKGHGAGALVQGWADKDAGGAGLNRRLIQRAVLAVVDPELAKWCVTWLGGDGSTVRRETGRAGGTRE